MPYEIATSLTLLAMTTALRVANDGRVTLPEIDASLRSSWVTTALANDNLIFR